MRRSLLLAALVAVAAPAAQGGAAATGVQTETQERMLNERDPHLPYNIIGLLGLLGLLGLRRKHPDDGYNPAPLD